MNTFCVDINNARVNLNTMKSMKALAIAIIAASLALLPLRSNGQIQDTVNLKTTNKRLMANLVLIIWKSLWVIPLLLVLMNLNQ